MPEKIIISFDDEKPKKADEKIVVEIKSEKKINPGEEIKKSVVSNYYRGNQQLTGCESSNLRYPEGLENGFRKIYSIKLNDVFLNSVLLNNEYVVSASSSGNVYFIDRFKGVLRSKHSLANEAFEKTGIVIDNYVIINSIKSIYGFDISADIIKEKKLYSSGDSFYLWSNINKINENVVFLEYSPIEKKARIVSFGIIPENSDIPDVKSGIDISVLKHLFDSVIIYKDFIFIFYDDKIMKYSIGNSAFKEYSLNFYINADTNFLLLDGKIYFNNKNNELFYFDIANEDIKFTGIKCMYINSLAGFNDNIIIGVLNGWYLYKTSGVQVFYYEDIKENKIESINKNILAVSNENKIVFHNLNRFHEAEGFIVTSGAMDSDKIVSARIGDDAVFVLTKNGILEVFNNDKLNLLVD